MGSKNKKFSINLPIELYEKVSQISEDSDKTITSTIRQAITHWVKTGVEENPSEYKANDDRALINQLKEHNRTLENLLESANKALDQEQQLHAQTQKNHQSELAQIKGRGFLKRLKAVFAS